MTPPISIMDYYSGNSVPIIRQNTKHYNHYINLTEPILLSQQFIINWYTNNQDYI